MTAAELAAALTQRRGDRRRGHPGPPGPHRRRGRQGARLPARRRRRRARAGATDRRRSAGDGHRSAPLAGVPVAVKDVFTTTGVPTTCGSEILEGWHPPYDATVTAQAASGAGAVTPRQDEHGRVRDGLLHRELRRSGPPTTRGTWTRSPAARPAARPPRSPPTRRRWPSAPTPAARSASPPRSAASSAPSRPTAVSSRYGVVAFASSAWTRRARSAGPYSTPRCCTRPCPGTTRWTPPRSTRRCRRWSAAAAATATSAACGSAWSRELCGEGYQPRRAGPVRRGGGAARVTRREGRPRSSCPHFKYALPAYYLIAPSEVLVQPGPVRRHAVRAAGRRRRHRTPRRSWR